MYFLWAEPPGFATVVFLVPISVYLNRAKKSFKFLGGAFT
jgi:hypothetical protein